MKLIKEILKFKKNIKRTLFTTPTHGQGAFVPPESKKLLGKRIFEADFSEIDNFDNIREPEGILLESQNNAAEIYRAKNSFYLYNGSTSGIIALMMSVCKEGDKVLVSRNCHLSVYNALVLTGAIPIWVMPDFIEEWGFWAQISAKSIKEKLEQYSDIKAVFITNPTYEGVVSDVKSISEVCNEHKALLIVDEAHGALWNFSNDLPVSAILEGADASVQSLHKTAGSLTQSAVLHLSKSSTINLEKVQECLNIINSTSPSYPLLASIEGCIAFLSSLNGKKELQKLIKNIEKFKLSLLKNKKIKVFDNQNDITKLFISVKGLSGYDLSTLLGEKFNIEDEMATEKGCLFLCGLGTTSNKLDILKNALLKIAAKNNQNKPVENTFKIILPQIVCTPREAFFADTQTLPRAESVGRVSKELIIPYPPGVPFLIPGEKIQQEHLDFLKENVRVVNSITSQT